MSQQTIVQTGAFTDRSKKAINENFAELYGSPTVGSLTDAHLLVGDAADVAQDVAVSGDVSLANTGAMTVTGINGTDVTLDGGEIDTATLGVAAGYKIARGITALDASNPTTIVTGLASITGFSATLNRSTAVSSGTAFVTYGTITGGSIDVYGWVLAGSASTGTENVAWVAVGT